MRRTALIVTCLCLVSVAAFFVLPLCTSRPSADAATDWLKELDAIAKEFKGEIIVEGDPHELAPPRRMIYYTPETGRLNSVFAGACYALHINGNPEAVIAIESSGDKENPVTYIEIARLSGWAMNVYRNGEKVAGFPQQSEVAGAYVGMTK